MSNDVAKPAARVTPNQAIFAMYLGHMREDAQRAGDDATEQAAYAVLWFMGSGRAFTGFQRAGAHMSKGTVRALLGRIRRGMQAEGKARRGAVDSIVAGDLSNAVLAAALGCADVAAAEQLCCNHPYGQRFTLG